MGDKKTNKPITSLSNKHCEPAVIRKFVRPYGFPVYVALICGDDLSDLDALVDKMSEQWETCPRGIQDLRNFFGNMTNELVKHYPKMEGCAVLAFSDKSVISSLWGDYMTFLACKQELLLTILMTSFV